MKTMSDFFLPAASNSNSNSNKRKQTSGTPPTPSTPATPASTSSFSTNNSTSTRTPQSPPTPLSSPSTPPSPPGNGNSNHTPGTPATPRSCYNSSASRSSTKKQKQKQKCISHSSHSQSPPQPQPQPPPRKQQQQLYLDFGQASFGSRSICPICNTLIVHGLQEDESQHEQICKEYKLGVSFYFPKARIVGLGLGHGIGIGIGTGTGTGTGTGIAQSKAQAQAGYIVEIRPGDPISWRKKFTRVKEIVDQELGFVTSSSAETGMGISNGIVSQSRSDECYTYCWGDNQNNNTSSNNNFHTHPNMIVFLYVVEKRVVGFCSAEVISKGYRLLDPHTSTHSNTNSNTKQSDPITEEYPARALPPLAEKASASTTAAGPTTRSTKPTKAIMGVHQLWCHHSHRQKGIASQLVDAARSKLVFGMTVPYHLVAFSSPTADGALFAKRYSFPDPPLVYEYEV